jgi:hypothetical protein
VTFSEGQEPTTGLFGAPTRFGRLRALVLILRAMQQADAPVPPAAPREVMP